MVENPRTERKESVDDSEVSFEAIMAFQRRMQSDPDSVSDEEIQTEYGTDISPDDLRNLFRKTTFGRAPKKPRASARAKLRRRLVWLSRSLQEVESAVAEVRDTPGRINKENELEEVLAAIEAFRSAVKLPASRELPDVDLDLFERMFGTAMHEEQLSEIAPHKQED